MKTTPVKDIGSAVMNLAPVQAGRNAGAGDFQKIWSSQMDRGTQDSRGAAEKQNADGAKKAGQVQDNRQMQSKAASKIRDEQRLQEREQGTVEELSPEELERAAEALGSAAMELMQQIADVFGISMEELQAVMGELNMEPADLLDASALGGLILQLGGAADVYALVTDEELYGKYQMLMEQLQGVLQENAEEFNLNPETLAGLAKAGQAVEEVSDEAAGDPEAGLTGTNTSDMNANGTEGALQKWQETQDTSDRDGGQTRDNGRQPDGKEGKGEYTNILIQNIRNEQFQPGAVQTDNIVQNSPWTEQTRNIMDQIMDYMKLQLGSDTTSLEMQLHPASLGTLQVQIASKGGIVTANFITQNETVKAALESQMIQLRESFEEQGVKVEAIEVTVQTHEFERNLEQGRGRNQQEPEKKSRVRRIHLGDIQSMETLDEEDALTAEMMAADGSTVNYTA